MTSAWLSFYQDVLAERELILNGVLATLKLTAVISCTGLLTSIAVFYLSISPSAWVRRLAGYYKSFFIGTPLICILYVLYYGLPSLGLHISPFVVAVFAFTLNVAAYNAAYLLTAYNGLDPSEIEAAKAQGFSHLQSYRYIILPQIMRASVPALTNQVIHNLKDSSIAFLVQYPEFFARMQELAAGNFEFMKTYFVSMLFYVFVTALITLASLKIEKSLSQART